MGTKTISTSDFDVKNANHLVKLNNPLMGTKTTSTKGTSMDSVTVMC